MFHLIVVNTCLFLIAEVLFWGSNFVWGVGVLGLMLITTFLLARDHHLSPFPESVILTGFDFV